MSFDVSPLDEIAEVVDSLHKTPSYVEHGRPMVRVTDVKYGELDLSKTLRVDDATFKEFSRRYTPSAGDIIITRVGTYGVFGKVVNPSFCLGQNTAAIIPKSISADYLYAVLNSDFVRSQIEAGVVGSTQKTLSLKAIKALKIPRMGASYEAEVASFSSALDDRITLLRETNATLEAIAQALFKSWFVDFDPLRAKIEGRTPEGMDEATAALFPDGFETSELGEVPRGWRVMPVGDAIEAVGGATPDTKNEAFWEPRTHCWTSPKDLSGIAAPVLLNTERKVSDQGLAKIGSGLLPSGTLLMSSRAPIGYLALSQVPLAINQGYIAMLPGGLLPSLYMYFWCRQNMDNIKGRANGSTFMEISKKAFRPIPVLVPSTKLVRAFLKTAEALFARLTENEKQAQTLSTLRDTLLPRLISGQLRLSEAIEMAQA